MKKDIPFILIVGRSGAGKDTYAEFLKEYGYDGVLSYTTRPKRSYDENTHIFISSSEADKFEDKIAVTNINGYEYFATKEQIQPSGFYIIDPNGVRELLSHYKNLNYIIVYLYCDSEIRKERALKRSNDPEKEIEIFNSRNKSENGQFLEFERELYQYKNVIIHNTSNIDIAELKRTVRHDVNLIDSFDHDFVEYEEYGIITTEEFNDLMAQKEGYSSHAELMKAIDNNEF